MLSGDELHKTRDASIFSIHCSGVKSSVQESIQSLLLKSDLRAFQGKYTVLVWEVQHLMLLCVHFELV